MNGKAGDLRSSPLHHGVDELQEVAGYRGDAITQPQPHVSHNLQGQSQGSSVVKAPIRRMNRANGTTPFQLKQLKRHTEGGSFMSCILSPQERVTSDNLHSCFKQDTVLLLIIEGSS